MKKPSPDVIYEPTRSSIVLASILDSGGELAKELRRGDRRGLHRTQLWRFATCRSKPESEAAAIMHEITGGLVAADGWRGARLPAHPDRKKRGSRKETSVRRAAA